MKQNHSNTRKITAILLCTIIAGLFAGCSVVSRDIRRDAAEEVGFRSLMRDAEKHAGQTFILGGYILETRNLADETRLLVLQAPLGLRDEPKDRDRSEGRFMVICDRFLDPAVYEKDRKITVAGELMGTEKTEINGHEFLLPAISCRQIHLWQEQRETQRYYHDPFYPWPGPYYPYRPYPYFYR
ncbi:MAG: Slp family lipoprotein [Thermodesulfobacteriota bacterium]